jgi:hypothetical protein
LRRGVRSHLFAAGEKRRSPRTYARETKTQPTQTTNPPTGAAEALARPLQSPPTETLRQTIEKKTMKIQVNTDNHITGREALLAQAEATVTSALGHLEPVMHFWERAN